MLVRVRRFVSESFIEDIFQLRGVIRKVGRWIVEDGIDGDRDDSAHGWKVPGLDWVSNDGFVLTDVKRTLCENV